MEKQDQPHVLVLTLPFQSFINPCLQLSNRLIRLGVRVTFMTSASAINLMMNNKSTSTPPNGLSYAALFDGYHGGFTPADLNNMFEIKRYGSQTLRGFIAANINKGMRIDNVIYSALVPWGASAAREFHVPSTLFWIQPGIVFSIYYQFFHGYEDIILNNDPSFVVKLPGLPSLSPSDLPSFFGPNNDFTYVFPTLKEHLKILDEETSPNVLVNTFDDLELECLKSLRPYNMLGVGPLIPLASLDENNPFDTSYGGDLYQDKKEYYLEWLNSKPDKSVVYVSFGCIAVLSKEQNKEIGRGLLGSGRPFIWVVRETLEKMSCEEELKKQGLIVPWCSQVEILSHPAIGCFLTHCGWNSTIESLALGVPMVVYSQWSDQPTNAKMVEDVWKTGVRMRKIEGVVEGGEVKRCLEWLMGEGERGEEIRKNAKKWKKLGIQAAKEDGSSDKNLNIFVFELTK